MNVILYVFDALRADHVSCYGYERETTPNLDAIAEEGIVFEQCISPSTYTRPVAVSLLTGLSPLVHGTRHIDDGYNPPVPPLPEHFREAGYETIGIGSMPNMRGEWGFNRGFDVYKDMFEDEEVIERREAKPDGRGIPLTRATDINRGFREWYESQSDDDKPFFAQIWSTETHIPYFPPEGFREYLDPEYDGPVDGTADSHRNVETTADVEHFKGLYDGEIKYNDYCLGELVDYLDEVGELEETLLLVFSDHGDGFGEKGQFGHGIAPHEGLIHVPMVVRPPKVAGTAESISRGSRTSSLVSLQDIYPTLLEYVESIDPGTELVKHVQGQSFAPVLEGDDALGHDYVFSSIQLDDIKEEYNAIRSNRWKFIEMEQQKSVRWGLSVLKKAIKRNIVLDMLQNPRYYYERHYHSSAGGELYDLEADPTEQENLADDREGKRDELADRLHQWIEECEWLEDELETVNSKIDIDDDARERLERLGYLQE